MGRVVGGYCIKQDDWFDKMLIIRYPIFLSDRGFLRGQSPIWRQFPCILRKIWILIYFSIALETLHWYLFASKSFLFFFPCEWWSDMTWEGYYSPLVIAFYDIKFTFAKKKKINQVQVTIPTCLSFVECSTFFFLCPGYIDLFFFFNIRFIPMDTLAIGRPLYPPLFLIQETEKTMDFI